MTIERSIDLVLEPYLNSKYLTHAYVESGFLFDKTPRISCSYGGRASQDCFDLASLTKALVTGPLIYLLTHQRKFSYSENMGSLLDGIPKKITDLTVESLLAHRSGLPAWRNFWISRLPNKACTTWQERAQLIRAVLDRMAWEAASHEVYSDVGYIILGLLIEHIGQQSLGQQFSLFKRDNLDCYHPGLGFPKFLNRENFTFVSTGYCSVRQHWLRGQPHDENCAALGGESGHCGLFATGPALGQYLRQLFTSPIGRGYFQENDRRRLQGCGLMGLRVGDDPSSYVFAEGRALGHLGFTGTGFWIDWVSKKYGILLTNRVISGRVSADIKAIRKKVFSILYTADH